MIIDTSCYPTNVVDRAWQHDGEPFTGERMLQMMDGPYLINGKPRRIDKAFIQPPQGNTFYNWTDGVMDGTESIDHYMAYTLELVRKYPDRFLGCFVYNPRFGVDNGVQAIERYVTEHGFKMVQFNSNIHAYRPDRAKDWLRPALKKCEELGVLVKVHTGDGPYLTNAIIVATDPVTGVSNLSYHRSMRHARDALATSLHSRGHLWRMYQTAKEAGRALPVAMVVGAHPLFMLAASARLSYGADERRVAGGLFGAPLELVRTPRHGIGVPAAAEFVLEDELDPDAWAEEGPFGEFTGYSSDRSTNNVLRVQTVMRRQDAWLVDVVGGATAEHLTLARLPREAEMSDKLRARFPCVTQLHYPTSGTHFHAYVGMKATRPGEARQVMLGLLGWDPYLKTVIAVDEDVDVTQDEQVLTGLRSDAARSMPQQQDKRTPATTRGHMLDAWRGSPTSRPGGVSVNRPS